MLHHWAGGTVRLELPGLAPGPCQILWSRPSALATALSPTAETAMVRLSLRVVLCCLAALVASSLTPEGLAPVPALERSDGTVVFEAPPRLVAASTSRNTTMARNATFYFTLDLPATAGEPLASVTIEPMAGSRWLWPYDLAATTAFVGDRYQRGAALPLGGATETAETGEVTVTFDPPVAPGTLLTLALRPSYTPRASGSYDFRVDTRPAGAQSETQYAGVRRLSFYSRDRHPFDY